MKVVFYTSSEKEYRMLVKKLLEEISDAQPYWIEQDGHFCFMDSDLAVVALDGALGMETVLEYGKHYPEAMIVWVTDDAYFARMAIRSRIFDFILRPLTEEQFTKTLRKVVAERKMIRR